MAEFAETSPQNAQPETVSGSSFMQQLAAPSAANPLDVLTDQLQTLAALTATASRPDLSACGADYQRVFKAADIMRDLGYQEAADFIETSEKNYRFPPTAATLLRGASAQLEQGNTDEALTLLHTAQDLLVADSASTFGLGFLSGAEVQDLTLRLEGIEEYRGFLEKCAVTGHREFNPLFFAEIGDWKRVAKLPPRTLEEIMSKVRPADCERLLSAIHDPQRRLVVLGCAVINAAEAGDLPVARGYFERLKDSGEASPKNHECQEEALLQCEGASLALMKAEANAGNVKESLRLVSFFERCVPGCLSRAGVVRAIPDALAAMAAAGEMDRVLQVIDALPDKSDPRSSLLAQLGRCLTRLGKPAEALRAVEQLFEPLGQHIAADDALNFASYLKNVLDGIELALDLDGPELARAALRQLEARAIGYPHSHRYEHCRYRAFPAEVFRDASAVAPRDNAPTALLEFLIDHGEAKRAFELAENTATRSWRGLGEWERVSALFEEKGFYHEAFAAAARDQDDSVLTRQIIRRRLEAGDVARAERMIQARFPNDQNLKLDLALAKIENWRQAGQLLDRGAAEVLVSRLDALSEEKKTEVSAALAALRTRGAAPGASATQ